MTVSADVQLYDQVSDLMAVSGKSLNQTVLDLLQIGVFAVSEQHDGNLANAVASCRSALPHK